MENLKSKEVFVTLGGVSTWEGHRKDIVGDKGSYLEIF